MGDIGDPQTLARLCGERMAAHDRQLGALGIEIDELAPGRARVRMRVRADMLNSHDTCHGGVIFSLADCAFALACNSRGGVAVAAACSIEFLAPARAGDLLVASAEECSLRGRTGIYDVTVMGDDRLQVALFRGRSRLLERSPGSGPATQSG